MGENAPFGQNTQRRVDFSQLRYSRGRLFEILIEATGRIGEELRETPNLDLPQAVAHWNKCKSAIGSNPATADRPS